MTETTADRIASLKETVTSLEKDVETLTKSGNAVDGFSEKVRTTAELITQTLIKVDNVQVSKDAAANALREGDRKAATQIAVLLSRRKAIVKKLNELGDRVDQLMSHTAVDHKDGPENET